MSAEPPVVAAVGLSKRYGAVAALDGVDLEVRAGEVHCLAGENGAGKSTLIKILGGAVARDGGRLTIGAHEVGLDHTPHDARAVGVQVVHQELSLLPDLSVAENLMLGRLPERRGFVARGRLHERARQMLAAVDLEGVDVDMAVEDLGPAARQLVEIARVISDRPRLVVFDEPTTALSGEEAARLLRAIVAMRDAGVAILYVSHRLEEMVEIGDRVTVLRDGRSVAGGPMRDYSEATLVRAMVGRDIENLYADRAPHEERGAALDVKGLRLADRPEVAIDLEVRRGEILGVAGLMGAGRTELLRGIFGADPVVDGTIEVNGRGVRSGSPGAMAAAGVGLLTEDRKEQGLLLDLPLSVNTTLSSMGAVSRFGFVARRKELAVAGRWLDALSVAAGSPDDPASSLSGGNQQKILLARWLAADANVLLFDEPTKGVDVGAKAEIYKLVGDLAADGAGVVVVSSQLPELLGLCDRTVVMRDRAIVGQVSGPEASEEAILRLATLGTTAEEDHVHGH